MGKIEGVCRMVAVPVEVISLIGWCGYLIGFSVTTAKNTYFPNISASLVDLGSRLEYQYTCYWAFLVVGLVMNVAIFIHLNIAKWFTGVIMNFLVAIHLAAGGAIIQIDATFFFGLLTAPNVTPDLYFQDPTVWILVEFVGTCISVVFVILYMLLWPCISDSTECCSKASVAPSDGDIILINRGQRLAFEEQSTNANTANPNSNSKADTNSLPSFSEVTRDGTLGRNVVTTVLTPSALPMTSDDSRYFPKSSSPMEEAPNNDTANFAHV